MTGLIPASLVVLSGVLMNKAVITANGGMPLYAPVHFSHGYWIPLHIPNMSLSFYADRLNWWGFSIGDIAMLFGGLLVVIVLIGRLRIVKK